MFGLAILSSVLTAYFCPHPAAPANLKRFNEPLQPIEATTYGFKGFPEMHMMEPKRPLRHQPSADVNTDVNRYFRRGMYHHLQVHDLIPGPTGRTSLQLTFFHIKPMIICQQM